MKELVGIAVVLLSLTGLAPAQTSISAPRVIGIGPNHRVLEFTNRITMPDGRVVERVGGYTEIATGLYYPSEQDGTWQESEERIELVNGVGIARRGPVRAIFAANANSEGATDVLFGGQRFRSHVLGLGLSSQPPGQPEQVVSIATVKDAVGELVSQNQIIYRNAFDGIHADILYTISRAGLEQEVIIRNALPWTPDDFGFDAASTRMEVTTVFVEAPVPEKLVRRRGVMEDETLLFGPVRMGPGKAFALSDAGGWSAPVAKTWLGVDKWGYLVEAVAYESVADQLAALPPADPQAGLKKPRTVTVARATDRVGLMPKRAASRLEKASAEVAQRQASGRGLSIDYTLVPSGNSLTLAANETYYVSGPVYVTNVLIEGGTVVKFTNGAFLDIQINVLGGLSCRTGPYRPGTFTAREDHSIGEQIGTNALSGYYADTALKLHDANHQVQYLRIEHAQQGISLDDGDVTVRHSQFTHCGSALALSSCGAYLKNVLIYGASNAVLGSSSPWVKGEQVTLDDCLQFFKNDDETGTAALTNSLLVRMQYWGDVIPATNAVQISTNKAVFQTVGAGGHYLAENSSYRNAGTTNIEATLLAELRTKTTYPPEVLSGYITVDTRLTPLVERDTTQPDLGYHYDLLDYVLASTALSNATLTIAPGTALGSYGASDSPMLLLDSGAELISEGTFEQPVQIARYNLVQEQADTNWSSSTVASFLWTPWWAASPLPAAAFGFTLFSMPAGGAEHCYGDDGAQFAVHFQDCTFAGGKLCTEWPDLTFTNCLFDRVMLTFQDFSGPIEARFRNSTFYGGTNDFWNLDAGSTWVYRDNLFDTTTNLYNLLYGTINHDYDGYLTNYARLPNNGPHDVVLATNQIPYQTAFSRGYYLPTNAPFSNLINAGSTNAHLLGLYHYTATTNQFKETNSVVDLGFHRVALSSSGLTIDTDGDGVPDYLEDKNGNGTADSGETDWTSPDSFYGGGSGPGLKVFTPLRP